MSPDFEDFFPKIEKINFLDLFLPKKFTKQNGKKRIQQIFCQLFSSQKTFFMSFHHPKN